MNNSLSIELRIIGGESLAKIVTVDNIDKVLEIASKNMDAIKIASQLEQRACKVPLNIVTKAYVERFGINALMFKMNSNGENELNNTSFIVQNFMCWDILKNGLEHVINRLVQGGIPVSTDNIVSYFVNTPDMNKYVNEFMQYVNLQDRRGCFEVSGGNTVSFEASNNMSIFIRKYVAAPDNA